MREKDLDRAFGRYAARLHRNGSIRPLHSWRTDPGAFRACARR